MAVPLSLAATKGISVDFFSSGYLDVSVHRVSFFYLCIQYKPVQEFQDHRSFVNSPGLFADFHAFQSLLTPRHPPCALSSLTTNIQHSSPKTRMRKPEGHTLLVLTCKQARTSQRFYSKESAQHFARLSPVES